MVGHNIDDSAFLQVNSQKIDFIHPIYLMTFDSGSQVREKTREALAIMPSAMDREAVAPGEGALRTCIAREVSVM